MRQAGLDVRFVQADVSQSELAQSLIAQTVLRASRQCDRLCDSNHNSIGSK
jgi:hypothetical protein